MAKNLFQKIGLLLRSQIPRPHPATQHDQLPPADPAQYGTLDSQTEPSIAQAIQQTQHRPLQNVDQPEIEAQDDAALRRSRLAKP